MYKQEKKNPDFAIAGGGQLLVWLVFILIPYSTNRNESHLRTRIKKGKESREPTDDARGFEMELSYYQQHRCIIKLIVYWHCVTLTSISMYRNPTALNNLCF